MKKLSSIEVTPNFRLGGYLPLHKVPVRHGRQRVAANMSFPISTFQDAERWAERVMQRYLLQKLEQRFSGQASYNMLECIYRFTQQMVVENKIERIHNSCITRMPKVYYQERSSFAVVLLLLSLQDPSLMDRRRRHRFARALTLAQKHQVPAEQLTSYFRASKGYSRVA